MKHVLVSWEGRTNPERGDLKRTHGSRKVVRVSTCLGCLAQVHGRRRPVVQGYATRLIEGVDRVGKLRRRP